VSRRRKNNTPVPEDVFEKTLTGSCAAILDPITETVPNKANSDSLKVAGGGKSLAGKILCEAFEKRSSESTPHDKPPLTPAEVNRVVSAAFQDDVLKCPAMKRAIEIAGKAHLARELGVAYQSMDKWPIRGMPRTEWTGETEYWRVIQFETGGQVTKEMLFKRSS